MDYIEKMRIGILTYHRTLNYGAFLQAYSLKKYIESLGHEVEIIDYWPEWHSSLYKVLKIKRNASLIYKIKSFFGGITVAPFYIIRIKKFEKDIISDLGLSKKVLFRTNDSLCNLKYDLIIYGSDQIWRYNDFNDHKGFDAVYFGDYISSSTKKVAYAASMGVISDFDKKEWLITRFNNFDKISVRENELSYFVSEITGKNIPVVIDPVFLNSKEYWYSYLGSSKCFIPKEKYVLF